MLHSGQKKAKFGYGYAFTVGLTGFFLVTFFILVSGWVGQTFVEAQSAFNKQINYQGRLTTTASVAVEDGLYNMEFKLHNHPTNAGGGQGACTGACVWHETRVGGDQVQITNGLFSIMLGSVNPFTGVDFNQDLYLSVNIGGTGSPVWDGEMDPRKVLGAVPAAIEAEKLQGLTPDQFVRTDIASHIDVIDNDNPALRITQAGTGKILALHNDTDEVVTILNNGNVGIGNNNPAVLLNIGTGTPTTAANGIQFGTDALANLYRSAAGTIRFDGNITSPGAGTNSEKFGLGASADGNNSVAIGRNAAANSLRGVAIGDSAAAGGEAIAIGRQASSTSASAIAIGSNSSATGSSATALGKSSTAGGSSVALGAGADAQVGGGVAIGNNAFAARVGSTGSIAIGQGATTNTLSQFVAGSNSLPINDVWFGRGITNATPTAYTIHATGGDGTDIAGASINIAGGRGTGTGTGGSIVFQTAPAGTTGTSLNALQDRMTIASDGNVGIGLTVPDYKLDVGGDIRTSALINTPHIQTPSSHMLFGFEGTANQRTFEFRRDTSDRAFRILISSSQTILRTTGTGSSNLVFQTGGTNDRMTIAADGNVGIGTVSPDAQLHVFSATAPHAIIGTNVTASNIISNLDIRGNATSGGEVAGNINFYSNTQSVGTPIMQIRGVRDGGGTAGRLEFLAGATNILTARSNGNVGIGNTNPSESLDINGNMRIRNNAGYINFTSSSGTKEIITAGSSNLALMPGGNVGIGNTSPGALLNIGTGTPTTAASGIRFGSDTEANLYRSAAGTIRTEGSLNVNGLSIAYNDIRFQDWGGTFGWNGATRIRFGGSNDDGNLVITNNDNNNFGLLQLGGTSSSFPAIKRNGAGVIIRLADDSGNAALTALTGAFTGSADSYFTGSLGVGISSPQARIHAVGTTEQLRLGYDASNYASLTVSSTGNLNIQATGTSGEVVIGDGAGDVFIGDTGLASNLVFAEGGSYLNFAGTSGLNGIGLRDNSGSIQFKHSGGEWATLGPQWTANGSDIYFQGGDVGIGNSSPADTLHVTGEARVASCVKNSGGSAIAGTCSSDQLLKENIQTLTVSLADLMNLETVSFTWRAQEYPEFAFGDQVNIGLVAQQVREHIPQLVETNGERGFMSIKYQDLPFYLLSGMKELNKKVEGYQKTAKTAQVQSSGASAFTLQQNDLKISFEDPNQAEIQGDNHAINMKGAARTAKLVVSDTIYTPRLYVASEAVFKGKLYIDGMLFVRNRDFAGSIVTDEDGLGLVEFSEPLPYEPVVNLTPIRENEPVLAVVNKFLFNDDQEVIGFELRTYASGGQTLGEVRVNYFVVLPAVPPASDPDHESNEEIWLSEPEEEGEEEELLSDPDMAEDNNDPEDDEGQNKENNEGDND